MVYVVLAAKPFNIRVPFVPLHVVGSVPDTLDILGVSFTVTLTVAVPTGVRPAFEAYTP